VKNSTKTIKIVGLFGLAMAVAPLLTAGPASAGYACKGSHSYASAAGVHPSAPTATHIAQKRWQGKMKNQYGLAWSVWAIAKGKQVQCVNAGGNQKTCVVKARPCKYVVG